MGLLYDHLCDFGSTSGLHLETLDAMRQLPVYEITNILSLFPDWERESKSSIPKRPPHPRQWVEWQVVWDSGTVEGLKTYWSFGVVIDSVDKKQAEPYFRNMNGRYEEAQQVFLQAEELYACYSCMRLNKVEKSPEVRFNFGVPQGRLAMAAYSEFYAFWEGATRFQRLQVKNSNPVFGLPVVMMPEESQVAINWPPFMAFGLLHCRNVRTEVVPPDHDPHAQRRRNRGLPPKKEYHVLRLELPNELRPRSATAEEAESERKMRFHLCRGHFKNLQHERYKNKGWHWWPAHWKGSKDLGTVDKSYQLLPRKAAPQAEPVTPTP